MFDCFDVLLDTVLEVLLYVHVHLPLSVCEFAYMYVCMYLSVTVSDSQFYFDNIAFGVSLCTSDCW